MERSAHLRLVMSTGPSSIPDLTEVVMDWDNAPEVEEPPLADADAAFAFNTSTNVITFNWEGVYLLTIAGMFAAAAGDGVFNGLQAQTGAGSFLEWMCGVWNVNTATTRPCGHIVRRFDKGDTLRVVWVQDQSPNATMNNSTQSVASTFLDLVLLDKQ